MFYPSSLQENSKYVVYHPYKLIHCLCWWVLTYENYLMYVKYISIYYTNMMFHFLELTAALSLSTSGMACLQRSGRGYFNHWISPERLTMQAPPKLRKLSLISIWLFILMYIAHVYMCRVTYWWHSSFRFQCSLLHWQKSCGLWNCSHCIVIIQPRTSLTYTCGNCNLLLKPC